MGDKTKQCNTLPMLIIKGDVAVPYMKYRFNIYNHECIEAALCAKLNSHDQNKILIVTQRDNEYIDNFKYNDIFPVGVIAKISNDFSCLKNNVDIFLEVESRVIIMDAGKDEKIDLKSVKYEPFKSKISKNLTALDMNIVKTASDLLIKAFSYMPYKTQNLKYKNQIYDGFITDSDILSFSLIGVFDIDYQKKQLLLEANTPVNRLGEAVNYIKAEEGALFSNVSNKSTTIKLERKPQWLILKEKRIKALRYQLNQLLKNIKDENFRYKVAENYKSEILKMNLVPVVRDAALDMCDQIALTNEDSMSYSVYLEYIKNFFKLPWNKYTQDNIDIDRVKDKLDEQHYGLDSVKENILDFIAARKFNPDIKGQTICLVGPPGVGKTSIVKSIAEAIGRKYTKIALSNVANGEDLRGIGMQYVSACPGIVVKAIQDAQSFNPIILLDEIDKVNKSIYNGNANDALLELLDPSQNCAFEDTFLGFPIDLSKAIFIATANDSRNIPSPLLNRMELIELGSYTTDEKFHIAKNHLINNQKESTGLNDDKIEFTDDAIRYIIKGYTREAGVRNLDKKLNTICRKAAIELLEGKPKVIVDKQKVNEFLKNPVYINTAQTIKSEVGVVNGLAWTSVGGVVLSIEAAIMDGTGRADFTGSLGGTMKDSMKIAISCVRARAEDFNIDKNFYNKKNIHVHAPSISEPKDGPSAGVTIVTALVSALTNIPVKSDIAMTGEITIHGKVLPIGGLREKAMAAYTSGIKKIIIPKDNLDDLFKVDAVVKENVEFIPVKTVDEVLNIALDK